MYKRVYDNSEKAKHYSASNGDKKAQCLRMLGYDSIQWSVFVGVFFFKDKEEKTPESLN